VAQVFLNRLKIGMPLQSDATVIYANNADGTVYTTDEQRANKSKYNTYQHKGLPPGAISNPGRVALSAAVNPSKGKYLYFCTINPETGETKFATSLDGHNRNVALLRAWCKAHPGKC